MVKYNLTEIQILDGIDRSLKNAWSLAHKSKIVCDGEKDNSTFGLGLFSLAIEEFGKAVLLKKCIKGKINNTVPKGYFHGQDSHDIKFKEALSHLPKNCTNFMSEITVTTNPTSTSTVERKGIEGELIVTGGTTGIFSSSSDEFAIDSELRMSCFYVDWDNDNKMWKGTPELRSETLKNIIEKFLEQVKIFAKSIK